MKIAKYFWDLNDSALKETKRILQAPQHPLFPQRMVALLSHCDKPKELFSILPKEKFVETWPKIRSYWLKKTRESQQRAWWETIYEQLIENEGNKTSTAKGGASVFLRKLGMVIKEKRIELGLSQKQLGHQIGLSQPILSQIEEGRKNITLFTLLRISKALGIKTLELS